MIRGRRARRPTRVFVMRPRRGGPPIATSLASSVTSDGVTFTFNRSMPVGQFEDGSWFVVSNEAFQITGTTPASAVVNGGQAHGMAVDPYLTVNQPFDAFIASGNASADIPYNAAGNIDPGATASPISIPSGAARSYVKSVRLSSVTSATGQWQTIDKYVVLTVLPSAPSVGSYRPGVASTSKTCLNKNSFNASCLRSLTLPASFTDTPAQALAKVPTNIGLFGLLNAEQARRLRVDVALGTTTTNYSRDIAMPYADCILQLHRSTITTTDRDSILARIAVHASDLAGLVERGWVGGAGRGSGAGQSGAYQPFLFAAAFLFNSSTLLSVAQSITSTMLANGIWISAADANVVTDGKSTVFGQAYFDEMFGDPWIVPDEETSDVSGRYTAIAGDIISHEVPVIALFQNGPGGINGLTAMLNGPNNNTNPRAATIAFLSQRRNWSPSILTASNPTTQDNDLHDLVVSNVPGYSWTGKPWQIPWGTTASFDDDWFTAGDGSITWNLTGLDFATETVTQYDIRYSLDRRSWIQQNNVGISGSITGLLRGVQHFVQMRRHSASGISAWSSNHPRATPIAGEPARGAPTTTGTTTNAAPVNTVAPVLVRNTRKNWEWGLWQTAASFDSTDIVVSVAVGYWSGFPAPAFTYQWKRNGSNITGATLQNYTCVLADIGQTLTCDVTATNGSGSSTVTSNGLVANAAEGFNDEFSTNTVADYSPVFGPTLSYDAVDGTIVSTQSGTAFAGWLSRVFTVTPGVTYRVLCTVTSITGSAILDMQVADSTGFGLATSPNSALGRISAPGTLDWNYTAGAGVTQLRVVLRNRNSNNVTYEATSVSVQRV